MLVELTIEFIKITEYMVSIKKTICILCNSYKQLKIDILKNMPFTLVPKHSLNT